MREMSDVRIKLQILADAAKYDASCASSGAKRSGNGKGVGHTTGSGICHSYTPDGRCVSLLKILLTNFCVYDCQYCVNRVSSDTPRARFSVDEVVTLTLEFYKRNYIEGLFLSSGVIQSPDYTMEQLVAVARALRLTHSFGGYIHLKCVPGASDELQRQAGLYADRLSANIELPTPADLKTLAPQKKIEDIDSAMTTIKTNIDASKDRTHTGRRPPRFAPGGQSTQMIVGATPSTDADILSTADRLYRGQKLRRVYYSAFSPIPHGDFRLPSASPPLVREHRLYQADWLVRFYGFDVSEITTPATPNLDLEIDPKLAWALRNRHRFPVDVNRAPRELLLRVPGLGARNVDRLLSLRRFKRIRTDDLSKLRCPMRKVKPWVVTDDFNPDALRLDRGDLAQRIAQPTQQLELFETQTTALTGQL
jgi:putative DNA modification/repair radical SAM protein